MLVSVAFIDPVSGKALCRTVDCRSGATVREAALAAGAALAESSEFALWNEPVPPDRPVAQGDRVDVLCPIRIDPKKARSLRAQSAGRAVRQNLARHGGRHQLHL